MWSRGSFFCRGVQSLARALGRHRKWASISTATAVYSFKESETVTPDLPSQPCALPESSLTHDFLIRQSCTVSAESASSLLTHVVTSVQNVAQQYEAASSELIHLYKDIALSLSEEGTTRQTALRNKIAEMRKVLLDMELLFQFVKKLMDSNAEVCFLTGAEFASVQASERIHSADQTVQRLFEQVKRTEKETTKAHQEHIESVSKVMDKARDSLKKSDEDDDDDDDAITKETSDEKE